MEKEKVYIETDIASLTYRTSRQAGILNISSDGDYYIEFQVLEENEEVPSDYNFVEEIAGAWIIIYDDVQKVFKTWLGNGCKIYKSGNDFIFKKNGGKNELE